MTKPTRSSLYAFDDHVFVPDLIVDESEPTWTGLYDVDGNRLMRVPARIGFDLRAKPVKKTRRRKGSD